MSHILRYAVLFLPLAACGDFTASTGEFGRLVYGLHSDYLIANGDLTAVDVLTGHPQRIDVDLTESGSAKVDDITELTHTVTLGDGEVAADVPFGSLFEITGHSTGKVTVTSDLAGELIDRIELSFEEPASLDLITWLREPYAADFEKAGLGPHTVVEGTQAAFVPIPMDATGDRIAGDFAATVLGDPMEAVVPGSNVLGIYEQNVVESTSPPTVYFVGVGAASVTVADEANGVDATVTFDVTAP